MKVKRKPPLFKAFQWKNTLVPGKYPTWIWMALQKPDSCLGAIRFRGDAFYIKTNEDWLEIYEDSYIVSIDGICEVFSDDDFEREFEVVSES